MDFSKENLTKLQKLNAIKVADKARELGVDPELALAIAWQESRFINQDNPTSGAIGIMQVMPSNAKGLNIKKDELHNPDTNIEAGVTILKENLDRYNNNPRAALVAYNASPKTADKFLESNQSFDVLPEETRNYLENIHTYYPLSAIKETSDKETFFQRPKAESITIDQTQIDGDGNFITQHPGASGAMAGAGIGAFEQLYKYGKPPAKDATEKAIREAIEKDYVLKAGDKWANAIGGPGGETVTQAARNLQTQKRLGPGETLTREGVALPPGIQEKLEKEIRDKQKIRETLRKGIPFYDEAVDVGSKIARGAAKGISKFAPLTTGFTGMIGGSQLGEAGERFRRGDIKGGILSGLAGTSNLVATQPFYPVARGAAGLLSIPLDIADVAYDPEQYSVVKESIKKEDKKAKGGLTRKR